MLGDGFRREGVGSGVHLAYIIHPECFPWDLVLLSFRGCLALSRFLWLDAGTSLPKLFQKWAISQMTSEMVEGEQGAA